ncbi:Acyl-CoA thioesterase [Aspergillus sclerotialis]|uniref:Acyl-CoA thioesterase n=1 Tax=Aspergillus sclerotialis TaxID=2070753 RepID=A0A3A2ZW76_9EURO|nr:Acyl-CoA thioesterase [Aspergillus sclerotialis]
MTTSLSSDGKRDDLAAAFETTPVVPGLFEAEPSQSPDPVYGGLLMGRAIMAAATGIGERQLHSLQANFIRRAQPQATTQFAVNEVMTGRNYSIRRVTASQEDKEIFSASLTFREPRDGVSHQQPAPRMTFPVEGSVESTQRRPSPSGIEIFWDPDIKQDGVIMVWMRSAGALGNCTASQAAALIYASDYPIIEAGLSCHRLSWKSQGLFTTSLSHNAWIFMETDFSDWHLFSIDSPAASGGTMVGRASCFNKDGNLVATFVQEAVVWIS